MTDLVTALGAADSAALGAPETDPMLTWRLTATYVVDETARRGVSLDAHAETVMRRCSRGVLLDDVAVVGEGATDTVTVVATIEGRTHGAAVGRFVLVLRGVLRALRADTSDVRVTIEPLGSGVPE